MTACGLFDAGLADTLPDGPLDGRLVDMMTTHDSAAWIGASSLRWKHVLPGPLASGVRILAGESVRQVNVAESIGKILLMKESNRLKMSPQGNDELVR